MASSIHAIVNPTSGNGRAKRLWPEIASRLQRRGLCLTTHQTTGPGDASRLGAELAGGEIVVVGGDGTVNEVVNGIMTTGEGARRDTVLSIIPCGTGRDFSRSLGIRSLNQAVELVDTGAICAVDVGVIAYHTLEGGQERYFVNCADVGLGAETAARINRSSKRLGGFLTYLVGATRTIAVFKGQPARVIIDGEVVHDGPIAIVVLANGRFHAGGMRMAPMASMMDGQLEVLILKDVPKYTLLGSVLPRVYRGAHIGHAAVRHLTARTVQVLADQRLPFEVDGEQPGMTDVSASVLARAIRVRAPACDI